ncbi:MAG: SAP domain-containing protein [Actinomycetia bacterium]|nr:SAP domain-containing protein [Actinomycetes bacterium]
MIADKRPKLDKNIDLEDFKAFYWLKEELVTFCREIGINNSGGKIDIADKIAGYLKTGKIESKNTGKDKKIKKGIQKIPESINDVIPDNYSSSQLFREYFESIIGQHFHFTAYMAKYIKNHSGITFKEYINEWCAEYERRKNKNYKPEIMKSCEYNQYIRDFFKDNPDKTRGEAIKYWKIKKSLRGDNVYNKFDLKK